MEATTPKKFMRMADILTAHGYRIGQQIGEGTYAKVRSAERISDGEMCAVKVVDRWKVRKDYLKKFMPRELELVLRLKHENVICTYEIIQNREFVFQVMQYAEIGDVLQLIHRCGFLPEKNAKGIFRDISKGMKYLHDMNIVHRDLKCENILIFKDNSAALSDFGFIRSFATDAADVKCKTFCGSIAYASPELLRGIPYNPKQDDIWGMGCILFTMLCGTMPFDDSNVTVMVQKQLAREFVFPTRVADKVSEQCKLLVYQILEPDTERRLTLEEILQSDWLK